LAGSVHGAEIGFECSFWPMLLFLEPRDHGLMHTKPTALAPYLGAPSVNRIRRWAGRHAFPAAMMASGVATLLFELSDGIGWALLVFGACFFVPVIRSAVGPQAGTKLSRSRRSIVGYLSADRKVRITKCTRGPMDMTAPVRQARCRGH
jgi:hypothetical protein